MHSFNALYTYPECNTQFRRLNYEKNEREEREGKERKRGERERKRKRGREIKRERERERERACREYVIKGYNICIVDIVCQVNVIQPDCPSLLQEHKRVDSGNQNYRQKKAHAVHFSEDRPSSEYVHETICYKHIFVYFNSVNPLLTMRTALLWTVDTTASVKQLC